MLHIHPIYSDYACNDQGEIFSRMLSPKNRTGQFQIIRLTNNGRGYLKFNLFHNGKHINKKVHQFVIEAINGSSITYGTESDSLSINHKDGNKFNNSYSNLEVITLRENVQLGNKKESKLPKGVYFCNHNKKNPYYVNILVDKRVVAFGYYPTISAAYDVSRSKFKQLFGEELPELTLDNAKITVE